MANPNKIQYLRYQDIQIPDTELKAKFDEYIISSNYAAAIKLLVDNDVQLKGKVFVADAINTIMSGISILQEKYSTNVTDKLTSLYNEFVELIDNIKFVGEWNQDSIYFPYNFVSSDKEVYMCIKQSEIGTELSNAEYWVKVGLKGEVGSDGFDVTLKYTWSGTNTYEKNDLVVHKNDLYVALKQNIGIEPGTDETAWLLFINIDRLGIHVGPNSPTILIDNRIWVETATEPNGAVISGTLKRYDEQSGTWEIMHPLTSIDCVHGADKYKQKSAIINLSINPTDWIENIYTYTYTSTLENCIVNVFPAFDKEGIGNKLKSDFYDSLSLSIIDNQIKLSTTSNTKQPLDLKIQII